MANLSTDTSGYQTGGTDTWTSAVENVTPHKAAHVNGLASAILQIQAVLGSGSTLPGAFSTLAERLAVQIPSDGVLIPPGVVWEYGGSSAPTGWLFCDGSAVSRTTYSALFTAIGTTYGSGDGSTTFNLPNRSGRVGIGAGTGSGLTARSLGATGGAETHLLTAAESGVPAHAHTFITGSTDGAQSSGGSGLNAASVGTTGFNNATPASSAHNNMQPFVVMNYIIRT